MADHKPRIVVVGSANTDLVVRVPTLPRPGETVIGGTFATAGGGKGANQAVAAARAGGHVVFVAKVGADAMGDAAIASYRAEGIDTTHVTRDAASPSGVALILVDAAGENSIAVAGGANDRLLPADVDRARAAIEAADVLLVQLEVPLETVRRAVAIARAAGVPVILNPAPARPLDGPLLADVAILTPNETEAALLTGRPSIDEHSAAAAAADLVALGPAAAVITLGVRGAFLVAGGPGLHVPAFPVRPVDTVAAGDVFNGCLAVAIAEGRGLPDAVRFAAAGAALAVTRCGAQDSAPRRDEIEGLYRGVRPTSPA
jgi:ribokinase